MLRERAERFMREAIAEAAKSDPAVTSPNPRVGAVIVEGDEIVARGCFKIDGGPHAERQALTALGRLPAPGAEMYVTLEPCSTQGRTGACTTAILAAELTKVFVGMLDPTPEHSGKGLELLRYAGVTVVDGVLRDECAALNPGFAGRSHG